MMESEDSFTGPVNLGNPEEFTILTLAKLVIQETGSSSQISFEKIPQDDPRQRKPDISLAQNKLKFLPETRVNEGLRITVKDFRERLGKDA
jgi:UDP-glucuronate decarboxylase